MGGSESGFAACPPIFPRRTKPNTDLENSSALVRILEYATYRDSDERRRRPIHFTSQQNESGRLCRRRHRYGEVERLKLYSNNGFGAVSCALPGNCSRSPDCLLLLFECSVAQYMLYDLYPLLLVLYDLLSHTRPSTSRHLKRRCTNKKMTETFALYPYPSISGYSPASW